MISSSCIQKILALPLNSIQEFKFENVRPNFLLNLVFKLSFL
jgi:hypothetical protein